MKEAQKDKSPKMEFSNSKRNASEKITAHLDNEAVYIAALSQGVIPHANNNELLAGLSKIGNYALLQALERKENIIKALKTYTEGETYSPEKVGFLKEKLAGNFVQEANKVEYIPEMDNDQPLPGLLGEGAPYLSTLTPVPFEQGTFPGNSQSE